MAILKIAKMGHPCLLSPAMTIDSIEDEHILLAQDMIETMIDANGTGLAATQVHEALSMIAYFVDRKDQEKVPMTVLINPVVTPMGELGSYDWEGCLSVPFLNGLVPRWHAVHLIAQDLNGDKVEFECEGFHARVLQHEIDHLIGKVYPQRMDDLSFLIYSDTMKYGIPKAAEALINKGTHRLSKALRSKMAIGGTS